MNDNSAIEWTDKVGLYQPLQNEPVIEGLTWDETYTFQPLVYVSRFFRTIARNTGWHNIMRLCFASLNDRNDVIPGCCNVTTVSTLPIKFLKYILLSIRWD